MTVGGDDGPTARQMLASDPQRSVWVSANAGSGKTKVLIDRVARLLLGGVAPQRILCLTYTRAAAAEMQVRLFDRLGRWAMLPEDRLRAALAELSPGAVTDARLAQARRLFAQAIETPGGLRIQTIHSFCAALLRRFPLEAGVSPGFAEMEARAAALMMGEVLDDLAAGRAPEAVAGLAAHHSGADAAEFLRNLVARRAAFEPPRAAAELRVRLGVPANETPEAILQDALRPGDMSALAQAAALLAEGSPMDRKAADRLRMLDPAAPDLALLEGVLLTGSDAGQPFAAKGRGIATKATQARMGALAAALDAIAARVAAARPRRLALAAADKAAALHGFAGAFLPAWAAARAARGALDFDDLVRHAVGLLEDPAVAPWVLWKLDGAIDHILVDEAQDTAPLQWRIVERLAAEFTAGQGTARGARRTLFVVGDRKQSIYSFQGADLAAFAATEARFAAAFAGAGAPLRRVAMPHSFRSSPAVLRLVDATFDASRGLALEEGMAHVAFHADMPGRCDLWPAVPPAGSAPRAAWDDPVDLRGTEHHYRVLARDLAAFVADLLARGTQVPDPRNPGTARPLTAGDVLILVRRRSGLFPDLIAALKAAGLPVAGADRMQLAGELAVRDLLAVLSVVDLPDDDLSLAAALRSPLFGLDEDALFRLAHGRSGTLWDALRTAGAGGGPGAAALAVLSDLMAQADFLRPYDLLERLLVRHDGRRRLLARLGAEAEDGIDALLAQALAYEGEGVPSLTGFLVWAQAEEAEVTRRTDASAGLIRVMTVHGAKGREAPLVILPDTARRKPPTSPEIALLQDGTPVWSVAAGERPPPLAEAAAAERAREAAEELRLLYVAMTRAQSWLVVAAAGDLGKKSAAGEEGEEDRAPVWYRMIADGMAACGAEPLPGGGLRLSHGDWPADVPRAAAAGRASAPALPAWVAAPAPSEPRPPPPLAPTALGGAKVMPGETEADPDGSAGGGDSAEAMTRGGRIHLLLEHLPGRPRADWPALAASLVPDAAEAADVLAEAAGVLDAPALAGAFGHGALAEVPFAVGWRGRQLAGTIDRLVASPDRVLAIDWKSNRILPASPEQVPEGILRQMGAYAHALDAAFPGRHVEVAVVWTRGPVLMPLPRSLVDAALARAAADLDLAGSDA